MASVGNGQFEFIDSSSRIMYTTAHFAISKLELWDYMKTDPGEGGYMFSDDNQLRTISDKISQLGYNGHSGCSFGCTMRAMQYIAKNGYNKFREDYMARC